MTQPNPVQVAGAETADAAWKSLYKVGGVAALVMAVFISIQSAILVVSPPQTTVLSWFTLFQGNPLLGLLDMDLLLIIDQVLVGLLVLSLYPLLSQVRQSTMAIALTFALLGIAAYFASATAFEMLSLSGQYAAAATEAQKSVLLAAGQVMFATWQGTAFDMGYVLEGIGLLLTATVMLWSKDFGRRTAWVGVALGVMSLVPPTAGTIGLIFALGSLVPLEIWDILVARRLLQLGRTS